MSPARKRTRRGFLRSVGAATLVAPFAQLALRSRAVAAPPKRALFVYIPDGCIPDLWHPTGSESAFTLPAMTEPLAPIAKHLVFLDGLTMYAGGESHEGGIAKVLTGLSPKSLDVFLGERLGDETPHRSLQLGVASTFQAGQPTMSFVGPNQPLIPEDDPARAFTRVFGGSTVSTQGVTQRRDRSVLDTAVTDLHSLHRQLGAVDRGRLELHLDALRELERRIADRSAALSRCDREGFNPMGFAVDPADRYPKTYHKELHFRVVGELQMDLAVRALACGATRIVTLSWSHTVSPTKLLETGIRTGHHEASHYGAENTEKFRDFIVLKRWFVERFVTLIRKLEDTPDGSGTLLDNTLVVLVSELGDSNSHNHDRVPFVLAGRCGGALRTGRYLDYRGSLSGENEPHTKLLVAIANAMGVPIETYGYAGKGKGPLPRLL